MGNRFWVPPKVSEELLEERRQREAQASLALASDMGYEWKKAFDADLQRVDPYLQLVWCPDPAPIEAAALGGKPGRWHIARHNPGAPMSLIPLIGENGEYREPGSWVFDHLKRSDLWDDRVSRHRQKMFDKLEREKENRVAREREERREELMERVAAARETRVSFNGDTPWSQNVAGRRGAGKR